MGRRWLVLGMVLWSAWAAPSLADGALDDARALFRAGLVHARSGAWVEAVKAFEEAYQRTHKPAPLFNLAGAQLHLGRMLAAAANYTRFMHLDDPSISQSHRRVAEKQLALIEAKIPRLKVTISGMTEADRLMIDQQRIYPNELDLEHWLDPGSHTVTLDRPNGQTEAHRVILAEGEHRVLPITLP